MKTILTSFILPPGLGIILAIIALWLIHNGVKSGKKVLLLAVILAWIFSTEAMGRFIATGLIGQVYSEKQLNPKDVDMIVVLTRGMTYAGQVGWMPTNDSFRRGTVAFELQRKIGSRIPLLISGGKTEGSRHPSEAAVLQRTFDRSSAQITPVILEESSTTTYENALQSAGVLQSRNAKDIFLVTSEIHMLRALAAFRGRGIEAVPFPVLTLERRSLRVSDYFPSWEGVELNAKTLYEVAGLIEYIINDKVAMEDVFRSSNSVRR